MASLMNLLRRGRAESTGGVPGWAQALFTSALAPQLKTEAGQTLVWGIRDDASTATITDQFKAGAEEYHRRYAASGHFEKMFRQAIDATGVKIAPKPLILDVGSGSGVNSIVPCRRLFPAARMIATDLSGELLAMLGGYLFENGAGDEVVCVKMDAMSKKVAPGGFDLVTGAAILHHLDDPQSGLGAAARALKPGGHAMFLEPFNGWSIMRLAFERILAEAVLRGDPLDPELDAALRRLTDDITVRSTIDRTAVNFAKLDDKWIFSRTVIETWARAAGFAEVRFVPHHDHATLYRDLADVQMRLSTGRVDMTFPPWAYAILDSFDAAVPHFAKRELMVEGTIVLTKAA